MEYKKKQRKEDIDNSGISVAKSKLVRFLVVGIVVLVLSLSGEVSAQETSEPTWVLVETLINPENKPTEFIVGVTPNFYSPRFDGSFHKYTIEETYFIHKSYWKDHVGTPSESLEADVEMRADFTKPPEILVPGEKITLKATVSGTGTSPGLGSRIQFEYRADGINLRNTTYVSTGSGPELPFSTYSISPYFVVPKTHDGEISIVAFLWNAGAVNVRWIYREQDSEDVNFELPPAEYIVGVYEITSDVIELIEENNGTIIDQCQYEDGPRALLVYISKEENIEDFIDNVENSPLVRYVEPNRIVHASYVPNDPLYPYQWGPQNIHAGGPPDPSAWDVETGDKNITIAIVDTGIQYNHEDLYRFNDGSIKYVHGYDWVSMDDDPSPVMTIENHGTHCTGIATAVMDNHTGIAGIAPNCSFIAERGLRMVEQFDPAIGWYWDCIGQVWNISRGIMDAADHDADIISMSFGSPEPSEFQRDATLYASSLGCILIAASGNGADAAGYAGGIAFPAAYPWVIAVGANNQQNLRAPFSQWGLELELVAPGVSIWSTVPWNDSANFSGTSMAAPHVAGVAALVKSRAERWPEEPLATNPWYHLNNRQIRQVLLQSAVDLGLPGWDEVYGYGKVDAGRAVRCVNISGNVLEEVLFAPISGVEVRVTSIEGPPGVYTTNENTTLARITKDGEYYVRVPPGVYSICAMAYGYIPSRGLGGERVELPAFDFMGRLNTEHRYLRLLPLPGTVFGNVTDSITGLPINKAHVSLDGPPHIYPPHPNVKIKTETNSSGKYRFILTYSVHPEGLYNISVSKSGYLTKTQNFTLNWNNVITDYYKCRLSPQDYNPPIVNFSLLSGPSELPDMAITSNNLRVIFNENATVSATIHNIGTADASNIVVQFFDGNPDADGTQIGTDQIIRRIAHEGTGTVQVTWTAIPGTHDIFVLVDPYNTIQEANENNNQAYKQITVGGAKTIYVDDDFTDDPANHKWDTIQEGITDANAEDTVLVYNGRYTETVVLNKRLTLIGDGMPEIDAQSLGDAINIKADNCTVKGFNCVNAQPSPYAGIRVDSSNNVIADNTCNDNYEGIYLLGSSNEIRNNAASSNNKYGIRVQASDGNIIANNMVKDNGGDGIYLKWSNDNRITDNDASNNYEGISLSSSNNNEVRNNVAKSNHHEGIGLWSSCDNIIAKNTAKSNEGHGIMLSSSNNNEVRNNVAKSNHLVGIGLWSSNDNRITDNDASNNYEGISLSSSNNNEVRNNVANSNHYDGIRLRNSTDNIISNNTAKSNEYDGISVSSSNNNEVRNNVANSNHYDGIRLRKSTDNIISNNTAKENGNTGIYLQKESNDNRIADNDVSNNVKYHGISLKSSNNNEVRNNVADSNHYDGIRLWDSTDNIISNNTVKNNEDDGISLLTNSNNNRIYMNNFLDNDNNVHSGDSTNIWHSPSERTYRFKGNTHTNYLGNYWDDYTGSDTDNDGIGDISYNIISDNSDNYPLKEPVENYFLPIRLEVVPIFFP